MLVGTSITLHSATVTTTSAGATMSMPGSSNEWVAQINVGTVSGTNPTLDAIIQHSLDGTTWSTLVAFTQITSSSASEIKFAAAATDYLKPLLPLVRASFTVGGTDSPTFTTTTVKLYRS